MIKLFFCFILLFVPLAAEIEFGIRFPVPEGSGLEPYSKAVAGDEAPKLVHEAGRARAEAWDKLNIPKMQQSLVGNRRLDELLSALNLRFSHFSLFGQKLVAVYNWSNAATGMPDRESDEAARVLVEEVRTTFRDAFDREGLEWKVSFTPYRRLVGEVQGRPIAAIDQREPLFFVVLKEGARLGDLERLIVLQKGSGPDPKPLKPLAKEMTIYGEQK